MEFQEKQSHQTYRYGAYNNENIYHQYKKKKSSATHHRHVSDLKSIQLKIQKDIEKQLQLHEQMKQIKNHKSVDSLTRISHKIIDNTQLLDQNETDELMRKSQQYHLKSRPNQLPSLNQQNQPQIKNTIPKTMRENQIMIKTAQSTIQKEVYQNMNIQAEQIFKANIERFTKTIGSKVSSISDCNSGNFKIMFFDSKNSDDILDDIDFEFLLQQNNSNNKHKFPKTLKQYAQNKDLRMLDFWISEMLENIQHNNNTNLFEMLQKIQGLHNACLKDLLNIIYSNNHENGLLVQKIWNVYLYLLEKSIIQSKAEKEFAKEQAVIVSERLNNIYQEKIQHLESKLQQYENQIQLLNNTINVTKDENKKLAKNIQNLNFEIADNKDSANGARSQIQKQLILQERENLLQEQQALEDEANDIRRQLKELEGATDPESIAKRKMLQDKLKNIDQKLAVVNDKIQGIDEQLLNHDKGQALMQKARQEIDELQQEEESLQEEAELIRQQLKELEGKNDPESIAKRKALEEKLNGIDKKLIKVQEKKNRLIKQIEEQEKAEKENEENVREKQRLQREEDALQLEADDIKRQLKELEGATDPESIAKRNKLQARLNIIDNKISAIQEQKKNIDKKIQAHQNNISANLENEENVKKRDMLQQQQEELENQADDIKRQLAELEGKNDPESIAKRKALQEQLGNIEQQLNDVISQKNELNEKIQGHANKGRRSGGLLNTSFGYKKLQDDSILKLSNGQEINIHNNRSNFLKLAEQFFKKQLESLQNQIEPYLASKTLDENVIQNNKDIFKKISEQLLIKLIEELEPNEDMSIIDYIMQLQDQVGELGAENLQILHEQIEKFASMDENQLQNEADDIKRQLKELENATDPESIKKRAMLQKQLEAVENSLIKQKEQSEKLKNMSSADLKNAADDIQRQLKELENATDPASVKKRQELQNQLNAIEQQRLGKMTKEELENEAIDIERQLKELENATDPESIKKREELKKKLQNIEAQKLSKMTKEELDQEENNLEQQLKDLENATDPESIKKREEIQRKLKNIQEQKFANMNKDVLEDEANDIRRQLAELENATDPESIKKREMLQKKLAMVEANLQKENELESKYEKMTAQELENETNDIQKQLKALENATDPASVLYFSIKKRKELERKLRALQALQNPLSDNEKNKLNDEADDIRRQLAELENATDPESIKKREALQRRLNQIDSKLAKSDKISQKISQKTDQQSGILKQKPNRSKSKKSNMNGEDEEDSNDSEVDEDEMQKLAQESGVDIYNMTPEQLKQFRQQQRSKSLKRLKYQNKNSNASEKKDHNKKAAAKKLMTANQEATQQLTTVIKIQLKKSDCKPCFTANMIYKFIAGVYQDVIQFMKQKKSIYNLDVICYEQLLKKYGLKKVAEKKFQEIMVTVGLYKNKNSRISLFTSFLNFEDNAKNVDYYDLVNFKYYMRCFSFFENQNIKVTAFTDEKVLVLQDKALELIRQLYVNIPEKGNDFDELMKYVRNSQVPNQKLIQIDFDAFMNKILNVYTEMKMKKRKHFDYVFKAADLDENGYLELFEFQLLYRHLEFRKYNYDKIRMLFYSQTDCIIDKDDEQIKAISYEQFQDFCIEKELFSIQVCEKFVKNVDRCEVKVPEQLFANPEGIIDTIKQRFKVANIDTDNFLDISSQLLEKLQDASTDEQKQFQWLAYRVLEEESKRLLIEKELVHYIPLEFDLWGEFCNEFYEYQQGDDI